ncbi:Thymidylate kinase family protein [Arthrobacter sp. 9AX]|uniref:thymidylate kinase n=1 Tax=Arthrobacter sp. 9AX TaxID=2653131 RepID=UPI0012F19E07|nr:thymidylate kinase [Arthrobacter sp. 9AX]VXC01350.1 Thymidylate kinase family protein [Arthrobacter sp. 9AX]
MTQHGKPVPALIVLLGIDGAGKSTAAREAVELLTDTPVLVLGNYSGRKTISALSQRFGLPLPVQLADVLESAVRVFNVLLNHLRAARFDGVVIMDRHLYCQLALRRARGIRRCRALSALLRLLPKAQAVAYFDITPEQAHERIMLRGEDQEDLADLEKFREGYSGLPWYPGFTRIDAGGSTERSALQLKKIIEDAAAAAAPRARLGSTPHPADS